MTQVRKPNTVSKLLLSQTGFTVFLSKENKETIEQFGVTQADNLAHSLPVSINLDFFANKEIKSVLKIIENNEKRIEAYKKINEELNEELESQNALEKELLFENKFLLVKLISFLTRISEENNIHSKKNQNIPKTTEYDHEEENKEKKEKIRQPNKIRTISIKMIN